LEPLHAGVAATIFTATVPEGKEYPVYNGALRYASWRWIQDFGIAHTIPP
jgi:hypothetical protein